MIICAIDGNKAYPNIESKIKITMENPFIKDSGEYTYEINFPMAIAENRKVFGNVHRLDVKKAEAVFDTCIIWCDGKLIIKGRGTVTQITQDNVKLQIVGGKSKIKYDARLADTYIDEIDYRPITQRGDVIMMPQGTVEGSWLYQDNLTGSEVYGVPYTQTQNGICGKKGYGIFVPTVDETNDGRVVNKRMKFVKDIKGTGMMSGASVSSPLIGTLVPLGRQLAKNLTFVWGEETYYQMLAVHPNFIYVLKKAMGHIGYIITRNDLDKEPFNRIYIANAYQTLRIEKALPHWTVYYFIEEVSKLFGASFVFDDKKGTVQILLKSELLKGDVKEHECLDEYNTQYTEEGVSTVYTDNLKYVLDSSENREEYSDLPIDVARKFEIKEFETQREAYSAYQHMSQKEQCTTILKAGDDYFTGHYEEDRGGMHMQQIGYFAQLDIDKTKDDAVELHIVPVAITDSMPSEELDYSDQFVDWYPSVPNTRSEENESMTPDGNGGYVYSVINALEGEDDAKKESVNKGEMFVYFISEKPKNDRESWWTHPQLHGALYLGGPDGNESFSLTKIHCQQEKGIDTQIQTSISFTIEDIPNVTDVFVFKGKKFIAGKIEIELENGRLNKIAKGQFYPLE